MIFYHLYEIHLTKHYTKAEFLNWNNEYVNLTLDKIDELMSSDGLDTIRDMCILYYRVIKVFTTNKETYIRIIKSLKKFHKKFGYFMNYYFLDINNNKAFFAIYFCIYKHYNEESHYMTDNNL